MNNVEITTKVVGKFYSAEQSEMSDYKGITISIDVKKLLYLYGESIRKCQIFIPMESKVDMDSIPDVEELSIDMVPTKIELMTDNATRYNQFEPRVVKEGDSLELE